MGFTPLKTTMAGPAPKCADEEEDIIDEAIGYFRAQSYFKNYSPEGPSDLTIIYLTCFIHKALETIAKK